MRTPSGAFIFIGILLLLDAYVFQTVKFLSQAAPPKTRALIYGIYWAITILAITAFLLFVFTDPQWLPKKWRTYMFATMIGLFIAKLIAAVFFLIGDLIRFVQWLSIKYYAGKATQDIVGENGIPRSVFLSWLGVGVGGGLFGTLLYGFRNQYRYEVKKVSMSFPSLPAGFKGMKIVHISDIHSGSFMDKKAVQHGVEKIMSLQPDLILFTGDLVNDKATEMAPYMDVFNQLKAPMGVYSTLGNHDYGDYIQWPVEGVSKEQNLLDLQQVHAQLGWRLLMNEHVVLEKGGDQMALIGIENWSAVGRFPKYGRMDLAYPGTEKIPFKILMSHDPSHWEAEVRTHYNDVNLMLSGHTHGMQFGVELPGFRWSPVQYVYRQWAGLYEEDQQKLYVNRGFGFIGYPGRVGILPEITLIELT